MKILIISAMFEELNPLLNIYLKKVLSHEKKNLHNKQEVYEVHLDNNLTLYFATVGIGKVNSTFNTQKYINKFTPDLVVNIGTAGAISDKLNILDIVLADKVAYHDIDLTEFDHPLGKVPGQDLYLKTSVQKIFQNKLTQRNDVIVGTILTGDSFVSNNKKREIQKNFQNVLAADMESASIVDTCLRMKTDVIIIRGISDKANSDSVIEFYKYIEKVMLKYEKIIDMIIEIYENK